MEQMSALRTESDRLVERVRSSEATVGDLERELAAAQEQVSSKKGEADRYCACTCTFLLWPQCQYQRRFLSWAEGWHLSAGAEGVGRGCASDVAVAMQLS